MKKILLATLMAFSLSMVCFAQESDEQPPSVEQVSISNVTTPCDVATFEIKNSKFETVAYAQVPVVCSPSGDYAVVTLPGSKLFSFAAAPIPLAELIKLKCIPQSLSRLSNSIQEKEWRCLNQPLKQSNSVSITNNHAPLRC